MRTPSFLLAALAALLLAGCSTNCRKACENVQTICAEAFAAQGRSFDVDGCADACGDNLDGCKNIGEQRDCVGAATACGDLQKCPGCLQ